MDEQEPPKLEYPLEYMFRVVAKRVPDVGGKVRLVVQAELGVLPDDAVSERDGKGGQYAAIHVTCRLTSEEQRHAVYARLKAEPYVVLML